MVVVVAAFSHFPDLMDAVPELLRDLFGPVVLTSERFRFDETAYYSQSMGQDLWKQLYAFEGLRPLDALPEYKHQTNRIEEQLAAQSEFSVPRPLNLDPGAVDNGKLILASTKDHAHRMYVGAGIFAEVTLYFKENQWHSWPWTYRDYQRPEVLAFLHATRRYYRSLLQAARANASGTQGE